MGETAVQRLSRPAGMKGQLMLNIRKNLVIATVISTAACVGWYFGVIQPRKQAYANFYKTLDIDKMYERQKSKGIFNCIKAIEEE